LEADNVHAPLRDPHELDCIIRGTGNGKYINKYISGHFESIGNESFLDVPFVFREWVVHLDLVPAEPTQMVLGGLELVGGVPVRPWFREA
jgi:hypothetical protein